MSPAPAVEELALTPRRLAELVERAGADGLLFAGPGEWDVRTIIAHLLDDESFDFRLRLERMLSEERPHFAGFPWGTGEDRATDGAVELLRDFALQRQASLNLLSGLRQADLAREAVRPSGETLTIAGLIDRWVAHDREHLAQAEATIAAFPGRG